MCEFFRGRFSLFKVSIQLHDTLMHMTHEFFAHQCEALSTYSAKIRTRAPYIIDLGINMVNVANAATVLKFQRRCQ